MVSRRIRFLFLLLTAAAVGLIPVLCAGDGALSGNGQALPILMYHDVVEDGQPCNTWTVTAGRFREDLQWLKDHGYTCILPRDLEKGPLPKGKSVLITFDDGYESNYRLAFPILKEFGDKAVISLITKYVDEGAPDFLTWDMCREMEASGLVEFGSHTDNLHQDQPRGIHRVQGESREDYDRRVFPDLDASIQKLEKNLDAKVLFFAYPYGQKELWASDYLTEHFAMTVTTKYGRANLACGRYDLPRYTVSMEESVAHHLGGRP